MTDFANTYQALVERAMREAEAEALMALESSQRRTILDIGFTEGPVMAMYSADDWQKYIEFKKKEAVENLKASLLESVRQA